MEFGQGDPLLLSLEAGAFAKTLDYTEVAHSLCPARRVALARRGCRGYILDLEQVRILAGCRDLPLCRRPMEVNAERIEMRVPRHWHVNEPVRANQGCAEVQRAVQAAVELRYRSFGKPSVA